MGEENYHLVLGKKDKIIYFLGPSGRIVTSSRHRGESSLEEKIRFLIFRYTKDNTITRNLTEIPVDTKVPEECKEYYEPLPESALDYFRANAKPQEKYKPAPPIYYKGKRIYPPLSHGLKERSF